jgi:prepilin-type N-terminal cleavage/methylation domain-containing protein/prepilin-type processing-associated H-X9-DG protein
MVTRRPAFTLIELLTVIAIIGILAAILVPVVSTVRNTAKLSQCTSNLRQLSMGYLLYADENKGVFLSPPNWQYVLGPYLKSVGGGNGSKQIGQINCPGTLARYPDLLQFSASGSQRSTYGLNLYLNKSDDTVGYTIKSLRQAVNPPKTVLFGDARRNPGNYTEIFIGRTTDSALPESYHQGDKINLSFLDGHVATVISTAIPATSEPKGSPDSVFWRGW